MLRVSQSIFQFALSAYSKPNVYSECIRAFKVYFEDGREADYVVGTENTSGFDDALPKAAIMFLTTLGGCPQPVNRNTLLACLLLCATGGGDTGRIKRHEAYRRLLSFGAPTK